MRAEIERSGQAIRPKKMYVRDEYHEDIKSGDKNLEVRVVNPVLNSVPVGRLIQINDDPECERYVVRIAKYSTLEEVASNEDTKRIAPRKSKEELLAEAKTIFGNRIGVKKNGYIVFELSTEPPIDVPDSSAAEFSTTFDSSR